MSHMICSIWHALVCISLWSVNNFRYSCIQCFEWQIITDGEISSTCSNCSCKEPNFWFSNSRIAIGCSDLLKANLIMWIENLYKESIRDDKQFQQLNSLSHSRAGLSGHQSELEWLQSVDPYYGACYFDFFTGNIVLQHNKSVQYLYWIRDGTNNPEEVKILTVWITVLISREPYLP